MKKKTVEEKLTLIKLQLHTSFSFAHYQNCVNVSVALAQAGYFVNIVKISEAYRLDIYKYSNDPITKK